MNKQAHSLQMKRLCWCWCWKVVDSGSLGSTHCLCCSWQPTSSRA